MTNKLTTHNSDLTTYNPQLTLTMKKILLILFITMYALCTGAKGIAPVGVDSLSFDRHGNYMVVNMTLDLSPTEVGSSRAQVITPLIVSTEGDTISLPSVGVYGRQRYIQYLRSNSNDQLGISNGQSIFKNSERPEAFAYHADTPYQDWMRDSRLVIRRQLFGCANCLIEEKTDPVTEYFYSEPVMPEMAYFQTKESLAKTDTLSGSAFVDFPVDRTEIYPDYRNNVRELGKIQASIDTVLNDKDVTITGVWLKGYASPESPYSHNTDLAIGRTEALKSHICQLYKFRDNIISTDYEPEDWEGLRRFVTSSNIDHKEEILSLIDSDMDPDVKEAKIKRAFPKEYKFMLHNFYPPLRHTDYKIIYEIRRFDNIDKIREVMKTKPNRLSLNEFFLLGNSLQPGSDEFNEVYETAVRMYPHNPVANINAANAALQRNDLTTAENYLKRAGDSPEANYARAVLLFAKGDYERAEDMLKELPDFPDSKGLLEKISVIKRNNKKKIVKITLE